MKEIAFLVFAIAGTALAVSVPLVLAYFAMQSVHP
jgi:ABC-type phosphate/phosphonate transport system permease subunit